MEEEWRDVVGYEGLYQVSNYGEVKSLANDKGKKEKILKPSIDGKGYKCVILCMNGTRKVCKIHRLVAIAFIPNPNNYPIVNHKDENKINNNVNNLEWCTNKYNLNYGTLPERFSKARKGNKNPSAKKIICVTTGEAFNCIKEASEKYNITHQNISKCCKGKRKSAGKHPITGEKLVWKYV